MNWLVDTSIAIDLRDGDQGTVDRVGALPGTAGLSIISLIELENGVYAKPHFVEVRRQALDILLASLSVLVFDGDAARSYRRIVATRGYSRRRVMDRMIAATAIAHALTLITLNPADFRDIPGLTLEAW